MDYQVSEKVQAIFDKVSGLDAVQKALDFIHEEEDFCVNEQMELTLIEAPTFHEAERAKAFCEKFRRLGLEDVHIDPYGNALGLWKGTGGGPRILVEAHLDTVFPFGSVKEVRKEGNRLYAPGIVDDTRGLAAILSTLRGMKAAGLQTKGDIVFAGTTREEGKGSLGGMKDLLDSNPDIAASISVDGSNTEYIVYKATGYKTYEINFYGIGGHASSDFGKMANPVHAAARFVAKVADFEVPANPRTTFCVSNIHAGTDAAIHAIAPKATVKINYRSQDGATLEELHRRVFKAVQDACDEESARWGKDTITWDCVNYCDVPAGGQDAHAPLVEGAFLAAKAVSEDPSIVKLLNGGCVNGNMSIARGLPCVTLGEGPRVNNVHNLNESFDPEGSWRLPQEILMTLLLAAGIDGESDSILV